MRIAGNEAQTGWSAFRRATAVAAIGFAYLFALTRFAYQDVAQIAFPVNDLTSPWLLSKAFLTGENPYSFAVVSRVWDIERVSSPGWPDFDYVFQHYGMVYPPTAFPLIAPFTLLHWRAAVYVYLVGSTAFLASMILQLARRLPFQRNWRRLCFVAFALALAPLHSGVHESNLNTLTIAFILAGAVWMQAKPHRAGVALALAMCVKPQLACMFFAYPWLRRKWKAGFTGFGVYASILATSVFWMSLHGIHFLKFYEEDAAQWSRLPSAHFDASHLGKFQLVNLQVLIFQFTHNVERSNLIAWSIFLTLASASAYIIRSRVADENEALGLALISILTLLPVYQRFYSAAVLVFVLYWAIENWPRRTALSALLLFFPFFLPLTTMIQRSALAGPLQAGRLRGQFAWNLFLLPHAIWIELALMALLLRSAMKLTPRYLKDGSERLLLD
jgi:hypothetical protein